MLVRKKSAIRIAIERNPQRCLATLHLRRDDFWMQCPTRLVYIATVRTGMGNDNFAPETGKQLRCDRGRGSIGAVDNDTFAIERKARDGGEQKTDVLSAIGFIDSWWDGLRWRCLRCLESTEDLLF